MVDKEFELEMEKNQYTMTTTPNNGETHYVRMLPAPFELDTASLSDLIAVMQWCKWELESWDGLLKSELEENESEEQIRFTRTRILKLEGFLSKIDTEVTQRLASFIS